MHAGNNVQTRADFIISSREFRDAIHINFDRLDRNSVVSTSQYLHRAIDPRRLGQWQTYTQLAKAIEDWAIASGRDVHQRCQTTTASHEGYIDPSLAILVV